MTKPTQPAVEAALREVGRLFREDENITSYGVEGEGITVYVEKLSPAASLPKELNSVPIKVLESGRVHAHE